MAGLKSHLTDEQFIEVWNSKRTLEQVAKAARLKPSSATVRASRLRKAGLELNTRYRKKVAVKKPAKKVTKRAVKAPAPAAPVIL